MCSSVLCALFPPHIYVPQFPVSNSICLLLSYMSYHHAGLQPANLVTDTTVLRSRRRSDLSVFLRSVRFQAENVRLKLIFSTYPPPSTFTAYTRPHTAPRAALLVTSSTVLRSRRSVLFRPSFFHIISSIHPVFRLFSTVYDRTTVRTSDVSYVPYEIFENFKFNMTYCTYILMPDFYARFTVRL